MDFLKSSNHTLQGLQYDIVWQIISGGAAGREAILTYFSKVILLNEKRSGMQVDPSTVSSDGLMINSLAVTLQICQPFLKTKAKGAGDAFTAYEKMPLVRVGDIARVDCLPLHGETKMGMTDEAATQYYNSLPTEGAAPHFVTRCFFITSGFLHYGLLKTMSEVTENMQRLPRMRREIQRLEDTRTTWITQPAAMVQDIMLTREKVNCKR